MLAIPIAKAHITHRAVKQREGNEMKVAQRKDGKFLVTRVINGRVFRNIMTAEQLAIEQAKPVYELTAAEKETRAIPFGQHGYTGN